MDRGEAIRTRCSAVPAFPSVPPFEFRSRVHARRTMPMTDLPVIIAGGGIGGLATALTLQQIGVPCVVHESVREMRPLGVGINLQPNAVRELYDLGIGADDLDQVGVPAREWAL